MNITIISTNGQTNGDCSVGKVVGKANSDRHNSKTFDNSGCSVVSWNESDSEGQSCNEDQVTEVSDEDKLVSTIVNNDTLLVPVSVPTEWINDTTTGSTTSTTSMTFFDSPLVLAAAEMSRPITCKRKRRRKSIEDENENDKKKRQKTSGRWTKKEHDTFLYGLKLYGHNWKKVAKLIPTRSSTQVRSHAQKYFTRNNEVQSNISSVEQQHQPQQQEEDQETKDPLKMKQIQKEESLQQHPKTSILPSSSDTNNSVNLFQAEEEENDSKHLPLLENPVALPPNETNEDLLLPVQQGTLNQEQEQLHQQPLPISTSATVSVVVEVIDECVTTATSVTEKDNNFNENHLVDCRHDSIDNNTNVVDVVTALLGLRQHL